MGACGGFANPAILVAGEAAKHRDRANRVESNVLPYLRIWIIGQAHKRPGTAVRVQGGLASGAGTQTQGELFELLWCASRIFGHSENLRNIRPRGEPGLYQAPVDFNGCAAYEGSHLVN